MKKSPFKINRRMPILNTGLVKNGTITFTDLDTEVSYPIDYDGLITVVPNSEIVKALKISKNARLVDENTIDSDGIRIEFEYLHPSEFPLMDKEEPNFIAEIPGFAKAIKSISYCAAKNDARYYLNGVLLEFKDHKLTLVSTDGHRLEAIEMPGVYIVDDIQLIIRFDAIKHIDSDMIAITDNTLICGSVRTKPIDGRFPDWRRVMPDTRPFKMRVEKNELLSAVKKLYPVLNPEFHGIYFSVQGENLVLADNSSNATAKLQLPIESRYPFDIDQGFNADYLLDAVKHCDSDWIEFGLSKTGESVTVEKTKILMPMRL